MMLDVASQFIFNLMCILPFILFIEIMFKKLFFFFFTIYFIFLSQTWSSCFSTILTVTDGPPGGSVC